MKKKEISELSINERSGNVMQAVKTVFLYLLLVIAMFCLGMLLSYMVYYHYHFEYVSGTSMQPTLNQDVPYPESTRPGYPDEDKEEDKVLIKTTKDVHAGEIVIVQVPGAETTYIKRILAEDGDMITMIETNQNQFGESLYSTYVVKAGTDEPILLQESYIPYIERQYWTHEVPSRTSGDVKYEGFFYECYLNPKTQSVNGVRVECHYNADKIVTKQINGKDVKFYKLDEDEIFYSGDHRRNSKDSRIIGTLKRKDIVGTTIAIIYDAKSLEERSIFVLWWEEIKVFFKSMWNEAIKAFNW